MTTETSPKKPKRYYGAGAIAKELGVDITAIWAWRKRFKDTDHPFPEPDVEVVGALGKVQQPGWSATSLKKIKTWHRTKDGVRPKGRVPGSRRRVADDDA